MSDKLQDMLNDYLFHSNATPELQHFKVTIAFLIVKDARHQLIDALGDLDLDIEQERRSAMQFVDYRKEFEALSKSFLKKNYGYQRRGRKQKRRQRR